jgi:long-chain acyl-CoA synthetase
MIVTEGGKNVYPEDIENAFEGLGVKELCVYAANYIWPRREMTGEQLVIVLNPENGITDAMKADLIARNRRLPDFKRISGYVEWTKDFPRTASMKIKRNVLADEIRSRADRESAVKEL